MSIIRRSRPPKSVRLGVSPVVMTLALIAGCGGERARQDQLPEESTAQESASVNQPIDPVDESHIAASSDSVEPTHGIDAEAPAAIREEAPAAMIAMEASGDSMAIDLPAGTAMEPSSVLAPTTSSDLAETRVAEMAAPSASTAVGPKTSVGRRTGPFETLPAGAEHHPELGFATISVFYATDRQRDSLPLSSYTLSGNRDAVMLLGGSAAIFLVYGFWNLLRRRHSAAIGFASFGALAAAGMGMILLSEETIVEKHGVTYNSQRGTLVKGICEVTVPDTHQRGQVERPSLLRFEVREDQREHVVLTSAVELPASEFQQRLVETIAMSPDQDLLVFIHGYNVDFESAVQRTAQIAVDLPFEGVPVCYSWPSQGTLVGYTVDETNAAWTQTHLKQFLTELAVESGAKSINVVAHSMGNRPATGAMMELANESHASTANSPFGHKPFDRVVLAAPDVDADRFRRDLAPAVSELAQHVTLYASSDDKALIASKKVHGYPRAGESGPGLTVVKGVETVDVTGVDLSLLGHSYYGDNQSMLEDLYQVVKHGLPAAKRQLLAPRNQGELVYWRLLTPVQPHRISAEETGLR